MQKKHSILVPIDGSTPSFRAFDEALLLAKELDYSIECLYVIEPVRVLDHGVMQSVKHDLFEKGTKVLAKTKRKASQKEVKYKEKITMGDPDHIIVAYAKQTKPGMIVIGSRGLGGPKELFLGSVSNYVVHKSPFPVLVIK
jgi:nucleotide-binding universal stress UspA family protein